MCLLHSAKFDIPFETSATLAKKSMHYTCHFCSEAGHKAITCPKLMPSLKRNYAPVTGGDSNTTSVPPSSLPDRPSIRPHMMHHGMQGGGGVYGGGGGLGAGVKHDLRPLDEVTCFKVTRCNSLYNIYKSVLVLCRIISEVDLRGTSNGSISLCGKI